VQKDTDTLTVFFSLLGSVCVKPLYKHVGEIGTWAKFFNVLHKAFTHADPKNAKKLTTLLFTALSRPARINAARRTVVKSAPDESRESFRDRKRPTDLADSSRPYIRNPHYLIEPYTRTGIRIVSKTEETSYS